MREEEEESARTRSRATSGADRGTPSSSPWEGREREGGERSRELLIRHTVIAVRRTKRNRRPPRYLAFSHSRAAEDEGEPQKVADVRALAHLDLKTRAFAEREAIPGRAYWFKKPSPWDENMHLPTF